MGTRNLSCAFINGEYKVAQYGQWDGYPDGQGLTILKTLRSCDIEKLKKDILSCWFISDKDFENLYKKLNIKINDGMIKIEDADKFSQHHPQLDRDMAGAIFEFIMKANGEVPIQNSINFAKDSLFCEWTYVIDFDKNTFEIFKGFNKDPLSKTERFYFNGEKVDEKDYEYYPIKLLKVYSLSDLPTEETFLKELEIKEDEE
jgi:hypothetical protein